MGLIDREKEKLKQEAKKKVLKLLLPKLIPIIIIIILCCSFFAILNSVTQKMGQLINVISTFTTNIWKWITQDYWIDLSQEIEVDYEDDEGNITTEKRTLVDQYIYKLDELGISLKDLRLLGDADYDDPDLMKNEDTKLQVEKYIKSFVVADLITSQLHRRSGQTELTHIETGDPVSNIAVNTAVDALDDADINILANKIDGGVYLYRTNDATKVTGNVITQTNLEDDKSLYTEMKYEELNQFNNLLDMFNQYKGGAYVTKEELENCFTVDESGNLVIAEISGQEQEIKTEKEGNSTYERKIDYQAKKKIIDYKKEIAQYSLPYEFLVELCMVTQNPEFVFHVAQMSLNTKIELLITDSETVIIDKEVQTGTYKTERKDSATGEIKTVEKKYTKTITTTKTSSNPILRVKKANAWSYYQKNVITVTVLETTKDTNMPGIYSDPAGEWVYVPEYVSDAISDPTGTGQNSHDEYWEREYAADYTKQITRTRIDNLYSVVTGQLIRKSDNFLGLLRNKTGEYISGTTPDFKVDGCKFDRNGINVSYKIPGRSIYEDPLSRLKSGEQMLYKLLEQNERTQPLVELMQYYMSFPEQEYYDLDEDEVEEILGGYGEEQENYIGTDHIVKTDEPGALKPVTKEELINIINATFSGKQKTNALSIVDTLIDCQNKYKVNAVFVLAFARQETSVGTANTTYVKEHNNWLSWNLGKSYSTPQQNIQTVMCKMSTGSIYFKTGKITIAEIGHTYCPNEPKHPTQGDNWVEKVTGYVDDMYSKIGIKVEDTVNTQTNNKIIKQAAECMEYLVNNGFTYEYGGTPGYSIYGKKNGKIDCSGYVSWVLYELGYLDGRWTSATFANNPKNWKKITNKADIKAGDIVVYEGHVEICAEDVTDVSKLVKYNAGSTDAMKKSPYGSAWHSRFKFALRILE